MNKLLVSKIFVYWIKIHAASGYIKTTFSGLTFLRESLRFYVKVYGDIFAVTEVGESLKSARLQFSRISKKFTTILPVSFGRSLIYLGTF